MTEFWIILLLIAINGIFAGAEIAVVALRKSRIEELSEQGKLSARAVLALRSQPERFLATVQVGITVVGATAAAFGGASIAARLEPVLAEIPAVAEHAQGLALGIVIAGVSYLSIVLGELVPKSLALRSAERYALLIARPLLALSWLARPLVWLLSLSANVLLRPFGDKTTFTETRYTAEELQHLVEEASKAGMIHPDVGEIASRALELPDLKIADVMVPRRNVVMVPRRATAEELRTILLQHKFSRLPVYDGSVDNVVGYVTVKDVLALVWQAQQVNLEDVMRPPYFVPVSKRVVELLGEMREQHMPFAIAVDEHGGTSGIVTMEDLVEELVGQMFSEHVSQDLGTIVRSDDGSAIVSGLTPVREINRALEIELPDEGSWSTVAGLYLALAGQMPNVGELLKTPGGIELEIVDATVSHIRSIRIRPPSSEPAPQSPTSARD